MNDPNFPSNLDIKPLHFTSKDEKDVWNQSDAIERYGIAGRIWHVPLSTFRHRLADENCTDAGPLGKRAMR